MGERYLSEIGGPNDYPILRGQEAEVGVYWKMERLEWDTGVHTLRQHLHEVAAWYRLIQLHGEALLRPLDIPDIEGDDLMVFGLRVDLLTLGLVYSKSALDGMVRGRYGPAFADIRHMLETVAQCQYAAAYPHEARLFYAGEEGERIPDPRQMGTIVGKIKKAQPTSRDYWESIYRGWRAMCKGSHPSGPGLASIRRRGEPLTLVIGVEYRDDFCADGFAHGLPAALALLMELNDIHPQDDEWVRRLLSVQEFISANAERFRVSQPVESDPDADDPDEASEPQDANREP